MTPQYKGMRWLKCDLHMHTPADARHWTGDQMAPGQEAQAAKDFAVACHEARLDVVGITDHNFLSKNFLPHLYKAFEEIKTEFNHKIIIFPGFEFEADVGKGMHVLCLFEPQTDCDEIDHILTECGVGRPRFDGGRLAKSTKRLPEILDIVQKFNANGLWRGIVIIPHVFQDSLFDNDRISEWIQQEEYRNPDLLVVEVPKPISQMSIAFQKLFHCGDDCLALWKRIRPIATLMSSDNKRLIGKDGHGKPTQNSIGYRYSWIKMSSPSILSLRQAFLDHESRIILPQDILNDIPPADLMQHSKVEAISIRNVAFLADQDVHFSPNLNCVIGGRGSGKSTLLEYLRLIFGKGTDDDLDLGTKERIQRIMGTLKKDDARLEVYFKNASGVDDVIVWENNIPTVQDRELLDSKTFFKNLPIQFYSQQQLNHLTESTTKDGREMQAERLLDLIDGFVKDGLVDLESQERVLKLKISDAFAGIRKTKTFGVELKRLQQEQLDLDRDWNARSEIQPDATRHQQLSFESHYIKEVFESLGNSFDDVATLAETIASSHVGFDLKDSPHITWFQQFDQKIGAAKERLAKNIRAEIDRFKEEIEKLKFDDPEWVAIESELAEADTKFKEACAAKGLRPDDIGRLHEINLARSAKQAKIAEIATQIESVKNAAGDPEALMKELHAIWREQYETRVTAAERANKLAILSERPQRFLEVTAKYQQHQKSFGELWQGLAPYDGRTRLGRMWESLGNDLYNLFISQQNVESPWQLLRTLLLSEGGDSEASVALTSDEVRKYIEENAQKWEQLRCSRVQDVVDMKLFRADGSPAGSISEGTLSDGQRNTAALALLLAQEGGPLVIDQPEDELDSNFVFRELIPMLRKVKSKRQIIIATHNANLPVNGDAEIVYAFEAREGRGEALTQGGLDLQAVTKAVLDIMEGSEEAFRRRREKYHF